MPSQRILRDHKRVGKRFVPPFLAALNMEEVNYVNDLLPHLVWIGLLTYKFGFRRGIELAIALAKAGHEIHRDEPPANFSLCQAYGVVSDANRELLLRRMHEEHQLEEIQKGLQPLLQLHPSCPMAWLGASGGTASQSDALHTLSQVVADNLDRTSNAATILQTTAVVIRIACGKLYVSNKIELPDFDLVLLAPDTEGGRRAGSFARSVMMSECSAESRALWQPWSRLFWKQNYRLSPCRAS